MSGTDRDIFPRMPPWECCEFSSGGQWGQSLAGTPLRVKLSRMGGAPPGLDTGLKLVYSNKQGPKCPQEVLDSLLPSGPLVIWISGTWIPVTLSLALSSPSQSQAVSFPWSGSPESLLTASDCNSLRSQILGTPPVGDRHTYLRKEQLFPY